MIKFKKNNRKKTWRIWLIEKLFSENIKKEEISSFISQFFEKNNNINNDTNDENELIKNILNLHEKTVEDVMVPRAEIISISKEDSMDKILKTILNETHSRMPVYLNNLDNILGMIHVKDIINHINEKDFLIQNILRDILYVAPSSPVLDLLKRMRKSKIHLGLVVDEHGGVDGLVTIEDLVEEIVGEIEDEHDAENYEIKIKRINSKAFIVDSSVNLNEVEKLFNINFAQNEKEEIDTVGGLVFFIAGKVPLVGEKFKHHNGIMFEVIDASERRINQVKVTI